MDSLQELKLGAVVEGLINDRRVTIRAVELHGSSSATVTFKDESTGRTGEQIVFAADAHKLRAVGAGRQWAFDGDGELFRLAAEAHRIKLAYLFDPLLAVHISNVEPLPHQIAAVYEEMLQRQPLRYLLADDPGSGKTIMAGLFIRELMLRGDLERCLIVCPANLADQWQDEMSDKFRLTFEIINRQDIEASSLGNPFVEKHLAIGRIDLLKSDDNMERLQAAEWDLVVVDEAHKMSAAFTGGEVKYTARYRLGQLLGEQTRHLLLLTATPHRGKEEDFQLFLGLLDADRFEGKFREGVHQVDAADLMRRMLKEELVDFDGKRLFPERRAYTVNYELSDDEAILYEAVTKYVTDEMNRVERLAAQNGGDKRQTVVGFALTVLQRRLASSPAAIHMSLKRRKERLQRRLEEARQLKRVASIEEEARLLDLDIKGRIDAEDLEDDLDESTESEAQEIVDLATAASTLAELETEVASLAELERMALQVRNSGQDRKWDELRNVLDYSEMFDQSGRRRKLVIFTEHRDTLTYLAQQIRSYLGQHDAVVEIHGSLLREERKKAQARFLNEPEAMILVATDAAGEGVNLQRAHLMVNYDLPWNPNRIEQRFGRIHRFGQREVCHLWNLVAYQTREGAVYKRLFDKLEEERAALGGKVFDVLGRAFTEVSLRQLMIDAIHFNTTEEARAWLTERIDQTWGKEFLRELVDQYALDASTMTASHLSKIKEDMDRAEARRLVPHFVASFFVEAFTHLGGVIREREKGRFEIRRVPQELMRIDSVIGHGEPVLRAYERVCFDKALINVDDKPPAAFVAPGHPLFEAVVYVLLERYRGLLRRGAVLVDDADPSSELRVMFTVESDVTDGRLTREQNRRIVSRQLDFVEVGADGDPVVAGHAPYLDYRALAPEEVEATQALLSGEWITAALEDQAKEHAIGTVVYEHFVSTRQRRQDLVNKTKAAVKDRLTKEITFWDNRAEQLKLRELAGQTPRINSGNARRRAEDLEARMEKRMRELYAEADIQAQPPVVSAGALVIPARLLHPELQSSAGHAVDNAARARVDAAAMAAIREYEVAAGRRPIDVSKQNRGWDIESRDPSDGSLRFIEVKGRHPDADTVCVTKNEWLTCLNKREDYYLAIVTVRGDEATNVAMIADPVHGDPEFGVTSVNLKIRDLVGRTN